MHVFKQKCRKTKQRRRKFQHKNALELRVIIPKENVIRCLSNFEKRTVNLIGFSLASWKENADRAKGKRQFAG